MLPRSRKVKPLMARCSNPRRPNRTWITNDPFTKTEVLMAENSAAEQHTVLRRLSEANQEPGGQTISTVIRIANAIMRPLTKRDWRQQKKVPQTGGVIFVANHISNADPLAVGQFLAFSGRWPRFVAKASVFRDPSHRTNHRCLWTNPGGAWVHPVKGRACCGNARARTRACVGDLSRGNDHS